LASMAAEMRRELRDELQRLDVRVASTESTHNRCEDLGRRFCDLEEYSRQAHIEQAEASQRWETSLREMSTTATSLARANYDFDARIAVLETKMHACATAESLSAIRQELVEQERSRSATLSAMSQDLVEQEKSRGAALSAMREDLMEQERSRSAIADREREAARAELEAVAAQLRELREERVQWCAETAELRREVGEAREEAERVAEAAGRELPCARAALEAQSAAIVEEMRSFAAAAPVVDRQLVATEARAAAAEQCGKLAELIDRIRVAAVAEARKAATEGCAELRVLLERRRGEVAEEVQGAVASRCAEIQNFADMLRGTLLHEVRAALGSTEVVVLNAPRGGACVSGSGVGAVRALRSGAEPH